MRHPEGMRHPESGDRKAATTSGQRSLEDLHIEFRARSGELQRVRTLLRAWLAGTTLGPDRAYDLLLVIADRLAARGAHNRFERRPDDSIRRELELFDQVAEDLRARGWPVHVIDCTEHAKNETALAIAHLVGPAAGPSR